MRIFTEADPEICQCLNWVRQGSVFPGAGIFTMSGATFNVPEKLTDSAATQPL